MHDVVVVGGGFGGLAAARILARAGNDVVLCEALSYLGGCASTFTRSVDGVRLRFETGATLFCGLAPGQRFARTLAEDGIDDVAFDLLDDVIEVRADSVTIPLSSDRGALVRSLASLPGAPPGVAGFLAEQRAVADALWPLFDDVTLLPPFSPSMVARHLARAGRYAPVAPLVLSTLHDVMKRHGVASYAPLQTVVQGLCQITVQCAPAVASAPFALSALDYLHRGCGHVVGGIGRLADALGRGVVKHGGAVRTGHRVSAVRASGAGYRVETSRGPLEARAVVLNLLPHDAAALCDVPLTGAAARTSKQVQAGYGAAMLYLAVEDSGLPERAHHLELVDDEAAPFQDGNHVFVSVSGRADGHAPAGLRAVTCSTHVNLRATDDGAAFIDAVHARMRALIQRRAPELRVVHSLTASPRTWQRFVRRSDGAVGGAPRLAGWQAYRDVAPLRLSTSGGGVWLVGDSTFPGQSTLAVSVGGERVGRLVARALRRA